MKLFIIALFLTCFAIVFASESIGYFTDPAHPGKCVYNGLVLSPGEEGKPKGECVRVLCGEDGFATIQGCGVMVSGDCEIGDYIDVDAPYGECCTKQVICP